MQRQEIRDGGADNGIRGIGFGAAVARLANILRARKSLREDGEIHTGVPMEIPLGELVDSIETTHYFGPPPQVVQSDGTDEEETVTRPLDNGGERPRWPN